MKNQRGFMSFEGIVCIIAVVIVIVIIANDINSKEKERERINKPTDVEILMARTYVKEFNENVRIAVDEVLICSEKTNNTIDKCKALIYDKYRIKYLNDYAIDYREYDRYNLISKHFLSTENK